MQLDVNYNKTVQKVQTPPVLKACILKCIGLIIYSQEHKAMLDAVLLLPGRGPFHEREAKDECPTEVATNVHMQASIRDLFSVTVYVGLFHAWVSSHLSMKVCHRLRRDNIYNLYIISGLRMRMWF